MIRQLLIKKLTPFVWKMWPIRKAEALLEYSIIEKDSGCQILWSIELIKDPKLKALIFQHVLEEFFHADLFEGISNYYSPAYLPRKMLPREILVDKKSKELEVWEFFAYAHVGEDSVNADFYHYSKAKNIDKKIASIFLKVSEDEANHIVGTKDILLQMVNGNKIIFNWLILKSKLKRLRKQIELTTSAIGNVLLGFVVFLLYFLIGFFTYKSIKKRFIELSSDEIVNFMKQQQSEL